MKYNVLFIGNSHTFFRNLPWVFTGVCEQAGLDVRAVMLTYPGVDLNWHINSYCAIPNIRFGGYDYVVLQQRSHPFEGAKALIEQGLELFKVISEANSAAVFMSTWSEKNNPGGQKIIDDAFAELNALCKGSLLAKCGGAWHSLRGEIELYAYDGEHQNVRGAYLNACVLAKTIFGIDPVSLPVDTDISALSEKLPIEELRLLQEAARNI